MRSCCLRKFKDRISEINRNFSHARFIVSQFKIDHDQEANTYPNLYIDIKSHSGQESLKEYDCHPEELFFYKNPFCSQFNYQISKIEDISNHFLEFIKISCFVSAYSAFEVYLLYIYKLAQGFDSSLPDLSSRDMNLKKLLETLDLSDTLVPFSSAQQDSERTFLYQEEIYSLEYLRLLRNHFVHRDRNGQISEELKREISRSGKKLNKYWKNSTEIYRGGKERDFSLMELDFCLGQNSGDESKPKQKNVLYDYELIDIFNIFIRVLEKIDWLIISHVIKRDKVMEREYEFFANSSKSIKWRNRWRSLPGDVPPEGKERKRIQKRLKRILEKQAGFSEKIQISLSEKDLGYYVDTFLKEM